jgi:hypothetical protein
MGVRLRCPECRETFPWDTNKPWPVHCPICRYDVSLPPGDEVVMPFISTSGKTKAADNVYKAMEAGSQVRAEAASEMTGQPVSEFSDLKITNMRDNLKQGEMAIAPVNNSVTQQMDAMKSRGMPVGFGTNGAGFSGDVRSGKYANAGAKMIDVVRSQHAKATGSVGMSSMPAIETLQPGYKPRA